MLYLQIASPKSSVLNFLDSNSFEVIISIFQRTEKVPDMERLQEIKTLWSKLYEINNVDIILIMIYTGLRPTELLVIITPTEPT